MICSFFWFYWLFFLISDYLSFHSLKIMLHMVYMWLSSEWKLVKQSFEWRILLSLPRKQAQPAASPPRLPSFGHTIRIINFVAKPLRMENTCKMSCICIRCGGGGGSGGGGGGGGGMVWWWEGAGGIGKKVGWRRDPKEQPRIFAAAITVQNVLECSVRRQNGVYVRGSGCSKIFRYSALCIVNVLHKAIYYL